MDTRVVEDVEHALERIAKARNGDGVKDLREFSSYCDEIHSLSKIELLVTSKNVRRCTEKRTH